MRPSILRLMALAAFFSIMVPPVAHSEFINSRSDWAAMSEVAKLGYVKGLFDEGRTYIVGLKSHNQNIDDQTKCAMDLNLTDRDFVDLTENGYEKAENWEFPPTYIFAVELRKVCLRSINKALKPQKNQRDGSSILW